MENLEVIGLENCFADGEIIEVGGSYELPAEIAKQLINLKRVRLRNSEEPAPVKTAEETEEETEDDLGADESGQKTAEETEAGEWLEDEDEELDDADEG